MEILMRGYVFCRRLVRRVFRRCAACRQPFAWAETTYQVEGLRPRYHEACFRRLSEELARRFIGIHSQAGDRLR